MYKKFDHKKIRNLITLIIISLVVSIVYVGSNYLTTKNRVIHSEIDLSNKNSELGSPKFSAYNTQLFIIGINQTHTNRGYNFTLRGYTTKFIGGWVNTSDLQVYPIIDGVKYDGNEAENLTVLSGNAGSEGVFEISFQVNSSYVVETDLEVLANITKDIDNDIFVDVQTVQNTSINHDITTLTNISINTNIEEPVLNGDSYYVRYNITDKFSNPIEISDNLTIYKNNNLTEELNHYTLTTDDQGKGFKSIIQENGVGDIGVKFKGLGYTETEGDTYYQYSPSNATTSIMRIESINGTFSYSNAIINRTLAYVFTGGEININGTLTVNHNSEYLLVERDIDIYINGNDFIATITTTTTGFFDYTFNLATQGYTTNDSITISILLKDRDTTLPTGNLSYIQTFTVEVQNPPVIIPKSNENATTEVSQDWTKLILPGIIIGVVIAGLILFQRFRMESESRRDKKLRKVDYSRFSNINLLYNQGRKREAIAYTYKIYNDLIYEKYGLKREINQTIREFAIICVMKYGLDPMRTYPYIAMVENIVYGCYDLDPESFEKSMKIFGKIFQEITGTTLDFSLATSEVDSSTGETTLKIGAISEQKLK